jgi:hypothetical protein
MPWPDFTELTFGYAYLRELERKYAPGGTFPLAPDFISQNVEAEKGYDVEVTLDGAVPLFLQLKRSMVLTRSTAREIVDGSFSAPRVYRMNLHKKGGYRQHKALRALEADHHEVQYVTSQIFTRAEFHHAFTNNCLVAHASAHFLPSEINLPDETQNHHVSFKAEDHFGYIYSTEPKKFERSISSSETWIPRLREKRRSLKENVVALERAVEVMSKQLPQYDSIRRLLKDKPIEQQASILAYTNLNAQLIFVKEV